jgi:putative redox protein
MNLEAHLKWTYGQQFVGRAGEGPAVVLDDLEGRSGATPMQLMLIGIGGCAGMDVVAILKKRRSPFTDLQVFIRGERAEDHPRRYTRICIDFVAHGQGVELKDLERAARLSVTKYCSALASLNAAVDYTCRVAAARG